MIEKQQYTKPALSIQSQIEQLKERRLEAYNLEKLEWALKYIGYYRLSGYWKIFEENTSSGDHRFRLGTTIDQILDLYDFDRKLRLHFLDALERIEISVKSMINNHMALNYSPFWFEEKLVFKDESVEEAKKIILSHKALNDSHHKFIQHYKEKYSNPSLPSWMIFEVLNFGDVSKIYSFLKNLDAKKIADDFRTSPRILKSWLRSLTTTRNLCAHHARLWNKEFTVLPEFSRELKRVNFKRGRLGEQITIIVFFLKIVSPHSQWLESLDKLLKSYSKIDLSKMNLPDQWFEIIQDNLGS